MGERKHRTANKKKNEDRPTSFTDKKAKQATPTAKEYIKTMGEVLKENGEGKPN